MNESERLAATDIFINQLRQKIGVVFGSPETTTGGTALKFYASVRLDVRRIGKVSAGEVTVGNRTRVRAVKNKVASPFAEAELDVRWGMGIDWATDLLDTAIRHGVVEKSGSHLTLGGKSIGQGRDRVREVLLQSAELRSALEVATLERMPAQIQHRLAKTGGASTAASRRAPSTSTAAA